MHDIEFFEEEHKYLVDGKETPSVTTILAPLMASEYKAINPSILAYAARRGSEIHEYLEMLDYGAEPEECSGEIAPYVKAYKEFLRDYKPKWLGVELMVASDQGYVGTLDRLGVIDGKVCVVDLKTINAPSKMEKFSVCCQTYAYMDACLENNIPKDASRSNWGRYALYLNSKGEYNLLDCEEYESKYGIYAMELWYHLLNDYHLLEELRKMKPIKRGKE